MINGINGLKNSDSLAPNLQIYTSPDYSCLLVLVRGTAELSRHSVAWALPFLQRA